MRVMLIFHIILLTLFCRVPNVYAGRVIEEPSQGYYIVLPNSIEKDKALPVLICLPGWGVKARQDINVWAFPVAKKGFLAIGIDIDYSGIQSNNDLKVLYQRIQDIINSVSSSYNINKNKIYIAGTSGGGMMSIALALLYPGKFKAIGVISGARLGFGAERHLKNAKGQLFCFYHGEKDKSISISEFYATKKRLEKNGAVIEFKVIPEGEHTLSSGYYSELVNWLYQLSELSS